MDLKEAQMRLDVLSGGMLAHTAMLNALIDSHPQKDRLAHAWAQFRERGHAASLNSSAGDGLPEAFEHVAAQMEQQSQISTGTLPKPNA